jgi:AcrR family transcriptional regulator
LDFGRFVRCETVFTVSVRQGTRERLVRAARELVEEGGYAAASVTAIAGRARVSAGALYRHFPSKAELFVQLFRETADREVAAMGEAAAGPGTVVERMEAVVTTFAAHALHNRRLAWALVHEPVDPLVDAERLVYRRDYCDRMAGLLRLGVATGELPDQDAALTSAALVGGIAEALVGPLSPVPGSAASEEQIVAALRTFCRRAAGAG